MSERIQREALSSQYQKLRNIGGEPMVRISMPYSDNATGTHSLIEITTELLIPYKYKTHEGEVVATGTFLEMGPIPVGVPNNKLDQLRYRAFGIAMTDAHDKLMKSLRAHIPSMPVRKSAKIAKQICHSFGSWDDDIPF